MDSNPYLSQPIPKIFVTTALPIIIIMLVNGLYGIVDAYFLGEFVGANALSAVTLTFPLQMMLFALATLFANGMASVLARAIGAGDHKRSNEVFVKAQILAVVVFAVVAILYLLSGEKLVRFIVGDFPELVTLSDSYIRILAVWAPITGILAINNDALRSEGKVEVMSGVMLLSAVLNVLFDYIFIAKMGGGVAASAYATVLAQAVSLTLIVQYRLRGKTLVNWSGFSFANLGATAREIIPLGIPTSLNYIGISLIVGFINFNVQLWSPDTYATTVAAHGVVTRLMTFAMLPLIGMSVAFQSILGNNYGARQLQRSNQVISLGVQVAFVYCLAVQGAFYLAAKLGVGYIFVDNAIVADKVAYILRLLSLGFFTVGPIAMLAAKFQAIGNAREAIMLGLAKNFIFMIPLVFILPYVSGELGIWLSAPVSDALMVIVAALILVKNNRKATVYRGVYLREAVS